MKKNTYKEIKSSIYSSVAYIGNTGRRAFDAVVFELADENCNVVRTITIKTSGYQNSAFDLARVRRVRAAVQRLGFRLNWSTVHRDGSVGGTIRLWRAGFCA